MTSIKPLSSQHYHEFLLTPIGTILLIKNEKALVSISLFEEDHEDHIVSYQSTLNPKHFREEVKQLQEYFNGKRKHFELPIDYTGTPFQTKVWQTLLTIPYGETRSYKEIAIAVNKPKAPRGVGQANRSNHLPLIIPCHRVVSSTGKLLGFGGNHIAMQEQLLALEKGELIHG